ncbi:UNVERIFIED_CONTAM: hypothetical protein PYX00_006618 [Menopon gallinae]|uniref:Cleavage and polyadenylation specificity factor subunit 1 n=1 Tax=Menopon gallinae TaxID=328185 RepID=A0AAW2HW72_9NEOP
MYSVCKLTHPSTSVEQAISCHFYNRNETSLVVAGKNIIRVFQLIPDIDPNKKDSYSERRPPKMKLECLSTFTLFANVMSMRAVSLAGSSRDALLLSFQEAKLCVVEYDPDSHDLRTLSLHYFEEEEMKGGWTHHFDIPHVRVDPEGRCAAMLVYGRKLVILPFRRESKLDDPDIALLDPHSSSVATTKAPVLSSYTITLRDIDEKLENVIDIQFLHGYYEPTLLILYEPLKTFAGRIAVRNDTCAMIAISLNIQQKVHPAIWSVAGLPFNCTQAIPVKKPLGGTLIFSVNALIYLNQSIPPFGVSVNSIADVSTNFQLRVQEGLKLTLECAQATFISHDRLVVSLKTGELYVLSLLADSMRSVRGFHFDKAAASVLTTCICVVEDRYLFLGSRLGNSLLLRFTEKESSEAPIITIDESIREVPLPSKRRRQDALGDWMASDVADIRDLDELEVYGTQETSSVQITSFMFEVCDSLLNIGPCGNVSMGEPAFLSEEFSNNRDPDLELVTTSGHGKNGAICVLQRTIRPQVVTTFELPGCLDMWTVIGPQSEGGQSQQEDDLSHAFLILSQKNSTMILQTGQEINEIDHSGFNTQGPTIFAGNLANNKYIVQVSRLGVRLLRGLEQIQHIPLDVGSPIVHASCADPYVALLTEDGQIVLLTLRESRTGGRLSVSKPSIPTNPRVSKICTYRDVSGLFTLTTEEELQSATFKSDSKNMKKEADDEDEMLYGGSEIKFHQLMPLANANPESPPRPSVRWKKYYQEIKPNYWLFVVRENGNLDIYSLPDFRPSFQVRRLGQGQRVLFDMLDTVQPSTPDNAGDPDIYELLVVSLGHLGRRPIMLVRTEFDLVVYQAFKYAKGPNLKIRFRRLPQTFILKERKMKFKIKYENEVESERASRLRYFSNISGYNGVFVCGPNPHWLFLTARGELRGHPMLIDGRVSSFAPFHNVNCPLGFLYFNSKCELRICVLPTHLSYDAPWPVRKVPLRCTPHMVTYHLESKTYCLVTSSSEPSNQYYRFNGEDKEHSVEERDERFPLPMQDRFSIMLFSPVSWEVIPNTKMDLDEWEHVTCLKTVNLSSEGTRSGLKGYVAVGTNYNYSEDITSKGRILIYDVIDVVPEPGLPLTKNRFKTVYAKEQKGPVTALCHVLGFLVSAMGQKIYIWQLKDNDLVGIAFIDTQIYIHQLISVKSLILVADVYKSISLLRFQEEYRTLSLVSRDFRPCEVYAIELLLDNTQMGFLISDVEMNIIMFMYKPEDRESVGGQRLLRKADFHLGQHINSWFRIRCRLGDQATDFDYPLGAERRHISMFATLDGALGFLLPLPEITYRRLQMLQNILFHHIPHLAGLNPKAFRVYKSGKRLLGNPCKGIVDGELVWMYLSLTIMEKQDVAKKIGSKVEDIIEDLAIIERLTSHF